MLTAMNWAFEFWDWMLLLTVVFQSSAIAYLYHPKWKALIISLPVPFTMAALAAMDQAPDHHGRNSDNPCFKETTAGLYDGLSDGQHHRGL